MFHSTIDVHLHNSGEHSPPGFEESLKAVPR